MLLSVLLLAVPACAETPRVHQVSPSEASTPDVDSAPRHASNSSVLVTPDKTLGRPVWVLGVLDFHTKAKSQDKGFDELRQKAAELGADAVTTAEFEHGEGDEPSHLSGIAVKYAQQDNRAYDVLGEIDIATKEDDDDKGFDQLLAKARALGADEVRFITFEHGAEGGMSHLKGTAVKHHD
jgi:uncharacterized protein YbjQ (UPF0145 family)